MSFLQKAIAPGTKFGLPVVDKARPSCNDHWSTNPIFSLQILQFLQWNVLITHDQASQQYARIRWTEVMHFCHVVQRFCKAPVCWKLVSRWALLLTLMRGRSSSQVMAIGMNRQPLMKRTMSSHHVLLSLFVFFYFQSFRARAWLRVCGIWSLHNMIIPIIQAIILL